MSWQSGKKFESYAEIGLTVDGISDQVTNALVELGYNISVFHGIFHKSRSFRNGVNRVDLEFGTYENGRGYTKIFLSTKNSESAYKTLSALEQICEKKHSENMQKIGFYVKTHKKSKLTANFL